MAFFFKGLFFSADEVNFAEFDAFEGKEGVCEFFYSADSAAKEDDLEAVVVVEVDVH